MIWNVLWSLHLLSKIIRLVRLVRMANGKWDVSPTLRHDLHSDNRRTSLVVFHLSLDHDQHNPPIQASHPFAQSISIHNAFHSGQDGHRYCPRDRGEG